MRIRFTTERRFIRSGDRDMVYLYTVPVRLDKGTCSEIVDSDREVDLASDGTESSQKILHESSRGVRDYVTEDCNVSPYRVRKVYVVLREGRDSLSEREEGEVYSSPANVFVRLDREKLKYFDKLADRNFQKRYARLLGIGRGFLDRIAYGKER